MFGVAYLIVLVPICWLIVVVSARVPKGAAIPLESLGLEPPGRLSRAEKTTLAPASPPLSSGFSARHQPRRADDSGLVEPAPQSEADQRRHGGGDDGHPGLSPARGRRERLLEWEEFKRIPWDVLILFGGGFALADALETSGFSKWAGARLSFVGGWHPIVMIVMLCVVVTLLSEVAPCGHGTAMMPVAAALATSIGVHPYFLMIPAVLAASSGFMLPVATAPNTIVYATGLIRVKAMARSGLVLDIAAAIVITVLMFLVVPWATGIDLRVPLP